ncbi:hypothetical protein H7347_05325 [Corynebacterium sp. zg-331]|uniref:hypothetical protein n=1 Tax=unclassified Corynebacterium TaxID=2624378 RepID=UPI00128D20FB|nr:MULTISPECIES: hypothetical protein [unclassified Corynebacterium]MBC3185998.1 hypothetical protein [Corynebacterium sp. zg-331]MPV52489.1 hypothetical protein [Corynebacterium sp. zg331]
MTSVQKYGDAVAELRAAARGRYAGPAMAVGELHRTVDGIAGLNPQEISHHMTLAVGATDTAGLSKGWLGGLLQLLKHLALGVIGDVVAEGIQGWWKNRGEAKDLDECTVPAADALNDIARTSDTAVTEILAALTQSVSVLSEHLRCVDPQASPEHHESFHCALGAAATLVDQAAQNITQVCQERDQAVRGCMEELERRAVVVCEGEQPRQPWEAVASCGSSGTQATSQGHVCGGPKDPVPEGATSAATAPAAADTPDPVVAQSPAPAVERTEVAPMPSQPVEAVGTEAASLDHKPASVPRQESPVSVDKEARAWGGAVVSAVQTQVIQQCLGPQETPVQPPSGSGMSSASVGTQGGEGTCTGAPEASESMNCAVTQVAAVGIEAGIDVVKYGLEVAHQVSEEVSQAAHAFLDSMVEVDIAGAGDASSCEHACDQSQLPAEPCAETTPPMTDESTGEEKECPSPPEKMENPSEECPSAPPEPTAVTIEDLASVPEPEPPAEKLAHMEGAEWSPRDDAVSENQDNDNGSEAQEGETECEEDGVAAPGEERSDPSAEKSPGGARKAGVW